MPTWPATLPESPDADGYVETAPHPVVQAPVEGPPLTRRRYTVAPTQISARYLLDDAQLATFESFFVNDLKYGALTFTGPSRGDPLVTRTFRFTGGYTLARESDPYWTVAVNLIRLP